MYRIISLSHGTDLYAPCYIDIRFVSWDRKNPHRQLSAFQSLPFTEITHNFSCAFANCALPFPFENAFVLNIFDSSK